MTQYCEAKESSTRPMGILLTSELGRSSHEERLSWISKYCTLLPVLLFLFAKSYDLYRVMTGSGYPLVWFTLGKPLHHTEYEQSMLRHKARPLALRHLQRQDTRTVYFLFLKFGFQWHFIALPFHRKSLPRKTALYGTIIFGHG